MWAVVHSTKFCIVRCVKFVQMVFRIAAFHLSKNSCTVYVHFEYMYVDTVIVIFLTSTKSNSEIQVVRNDTSGSYRKLYGKKWSSVFITCRLNWCYWLPCSLLNRENNHSKCGNATLTFFNLRNIVIGKEFDYNSCTPQAWSFKIW